MEIPKNAVQIHLYPFDRVMRPRGSMEKESLGELILDRARSTMESWSDPKYGDSLSKEEVLAKIAWNAQEELVFALMVLAEENGIPFP